ncbi:MAG: glycogen synthase GlgA [Sulfuricella sp.]|nr:glycogen synthase GlgA [Sulfuricella sp.]
MAARKTRNPRVLFVTPEIYPLIKTGGLADVGGALPAALRELGVDVKVLVPGYPKVLAGAKNVRQRCVFHDLPEAKVVRLLSATLPGSGVPLLIVDCPPLFQRDGGPYQDPSGADWPDNARRFALLSRIGALLGGEASPLSFRPDIVHCNDWQSALAPAFLRYMPGKKAATVMTIHNLAFQGIFPPQVFGQTGLPPESFHMEGAEYYGNFSFLKAGLFYADHITTVSPNYAREIQQEPLGFGMQGLLALRSASLTGIVNGIDTNDWNPATDPHLAANYDAVDLTGKAASKRALQEKLGLAPDPDIPLLGIISRITHQKGQDLLLEIAPRLLDKPVQIALLGTGEAELENGFRRLIQSYPGKVGALIGFDEGLSHLMEAGADLFLMPSRFEPCGLNQMYSQRYGTPPVVHATGGLADTVVDANPATLADGSATGFVFAPPAAEDFHACIGRALGAYQDKDTWSRIQRNGMTRNFSWQKSAEDYLALYKSIQP